MLNYAFWREVGMLSAELQLLLQLRHTVVDETREEFQMHLVNRKVTQRCDDCRVSPSSDSVVMLKRHPGFLKRGISQKAAALYCSTTLAQRQAQRFRGRGLEGTTQT